MKLSITIEVDDSDPNVQCCGDNCIFHGKKDFCLLFGIQLEDYSSNKKEVDNGILKYETTKVIHGWKRPDKCTVIFSGFGSGNNA
jgi:hypothetical protein